MSVRRVLVLESQIPFAHGAPEETPVNGLVAALRTAGYEAETISIPFRGAPLHELVAHAAVWRLLDLSRPAAQTIDLVIATAFPTYFVRHPAKVAWLLPGHRAAGEWCAAALGDRPPTERDASLAGRLIALDAEMLSECAAVFAGGRGGPAEAGARTAAWGAVVEQLVAAVDRGAVARGGR